MSADNIMSVVDVTTTFTEKKKNEKNIRNNNKNICIFLLTEIIKTTITI